jgi:hypothetical protein
LGLHPIARFRFTFSSSAPVFDFLFSGAVTALLTLTSGLTAFQQSRFMLSPMDAIAYICFVLIASLFGTIFGVLAHYARAHFTYYPEDLGLGEPWDTLTRDNYGFEKHVIGAKWDDNGFWDVDSNRNLIYYAVSGFATPLLFGVMFFSYRTEVVDLSCRGFSLLGLTPIVCP